MKTSTRTQFPTRIASALAAAVIMACAAAAPAGWFDAIAPPGRVLPEHIKRVYVREFKNDSRLYAAQADLTLMVVDAFLSDGRLDVVQTRRCDARIEGTVKDYFKILDASGGDRIPMVQTLTMVCTVELWGPLRHRQGRPHRPLHSPRLHPAVLRPTADHGGNRQRRRRAPPAPDGVQHRPDGSDRPARPAQTARGKGRGQVAPAQQRRRARTRHQQSALPQAHTISRQETLGRRLTDLGAAPPRLRL